MIKVRNKTSRYLGFHKRNIKICSSWCDFNAEKCSHFQKVRTLYNVRKSVFTSTVVPSNPFEQKISGTDLDVSFGEHQLEDGYAKNWIFWGSVYNKNIEIHIYNNQYTAYHVISYQHIYHCSTRIAIHPNPNQSKTSLHLVKLTIEKQKYRGKLSKSNPSILTSGCNRLLDVRSLGCWWESKPTKQQSPGIHAVLHSNGWRASSRLLSIAKSHFKRASNDMVEQNTDLASRRQMGRNGYVFVSLIQLSSQHDNLWQP